MGKVVMPKNSAVEEEILAALKIYYDENDWLKNDEFTRRLKLVIGDGQYHSSYTKKVQMTSYYGFTEWEDFSKNTSPRRITERGKRFYNAWLAKNQDAMDEEILQSLENVVFGRNNCGCSDSDSDVEIPSLFIRTLLKAQYLTYSEFAFLLWQMEDCAVNYTDAVQMLISVRIQGSVVLDEEAKKYTDAKPIMMLIRWGFLEEDGKIAASTKIVIAPRVLSKYRNRLERLEIYNVDKFPKHKCENKEETDDDLDDIFNHNLFGIHIKKKNDALSEEHPHICIGWSVLGDLSDIDSKEALAARYDEHFEKSSRGRGQDIGQVWRFINDVKIGDYIIFAENSEFHIGRVESEYFFDDSANPNQNEDYKSTRTVRWLKKNINRNVLSTDLHNSLKTAMSIWAINDYKSAVAELLRGTYKKDEERTEVEENVELIFNTNLDTPYERNRIVFGAPGTGKSYLLKEDVKAITESYNGTVVERVTFHPEYSYSQFVGTYKPTMIEAEPMVQLDADKKEILSVLRNDALSAQEKYDLLYDRFKADGLTRLPILLGLYCDDSFKTKKQDGTDASGDNSVERNHGRAIRPYVNVAENVNRKSEIAYEYVPGPFMRMYVSALKSARDLMPQPHILIIEEINRAKVAAVFGDVFQLLDRDEDGVSEYDIQASEDIKKYLAKELGGSPEDYKRIRIPDNMFIWATMNSADQGVFPMDTAFKRRWNFEYLGIDENEEKIAGIGKIMLEGSDETVEWNRLRKAINAKMSSSEFKINEDKLMGPFFLSKKAIASNENGMIIDKKAFIAAFKSKVIMYLYEDAVKQGKHRFFDGCPDTGKYSAVCDAFDKIGTKIFGATFREDFYDKED